MEMQADAILDKNDKRIWSLNQLFFGSLLGGYLCGFYLLSENYKTLGYAQLAKNTLWAGIISSVFFFATFFILTDEALNRFLVVILISQGVLAAGLILYQHYKTVFQRDLTKEVAIGLPIIVLVLFGIALYIPEHIIVQLPSVVLAMIPAFFVKGYAQSYQQEYLNQIVNEGGRKNSVFKLLKCSILIMLIQVGCVLSIVALSFLFVT